MKTKGKPKPPKPIVTLSYDNGKPFVSGVNLTSGINYIITAQPNSVTKSVVFKRDETVRTDSGAPYEFTFTPTQLGGHIFSATPWNSTGATGTSGPTVTVTFNVVEAAPPPEPILKTATVTWTQIADATGYEVFWGTRSQVYSYSKDAGNNLSCQCPNLVPGTTYYFSAKSYNAKQTSPYGNEVAHQP